MDKQMLKLLASMPPEMLAEWETRHPAKWSIRHIERNYTRHETFSVFFFIWLLTIIAAASVISPKEMSTERVLLTSFGMFFLFTAGIYLYDKFISHRTEQDAIIRSLETAVKESDIDLLFCLKEGASSKRIREVVHLLLVENARYILSVEERFNRMRKKERVSETDVVTTGQNLLRSRARLDTMLFQAVQFGLSDGSPRGYFREAAREPT